MMMRSLAFACAALAALCSYADGTIELHDGEDLAAAVADEAAYDEIILHAGTYPITSTVVVDRKMTIRGADGTTPNEVVLQGNNTCGLMQLNASGSLLSGVTMTKGKLTSDTTDYRYGAAVDVKSASVVSNCIFKANVLGGKGSVGVVALQASKAVLTHCRLTENTFSRDLNYGSAIGLAVSCYPGSYVLNTLVDNNQQTVKTTASNGSMIGSSAVGTFYVENCTLVNNSVKGGSAVFKSTRGAGSIIVINTIAIGNTVNGVPDVGSATWYNSLTDVAVTGTSCGLADTAVFADFVNGDYRLTKNSMAAIDKGTKKADKTAVTLEATDLAGNDRIMGEEIDIGCYEFDPNERSVVFTVTPDAGTEPIDLTFEATPNGLGETPTYYWDFDGDGTADYITTDAIFTRTFTCGEYPVTLYASNLTAKVGVSYARAEAMVIEKGVVFDPYKTDWFFEPFTEPITATLTGDLGETLKFYWDWTGDGAADAVTDDLVLNHTFAAGSYPITVFASNETVGVGIQVAMDEPLTVLVRPRVTVTAADPEVGITGADIQRTINAAERGSIVTIPRGAYNTDGVPIEVLKEIELRGETGNPEDVIINNNATTNRLLNVDAGRRCLVHSMSFQEGRGSVPRSSVKDAHLCAAVMVASRSGFNCEANTSSRPAAGFGGCVSNVIVRNSKTTSVGYADCSAVYLKGVDAVFTHSVVSNCMSDAAKVSGMMHPIALAIYGGARGENLMICDNYSEQDNKCAVTVQVRGTGSVLRYSTVVNNRAPWCGGVNVYDGGRFECCDIAGNQATRAGGLERRNVWAAFGFPENGRPTWNKADGYSMAPELADEAANAAKEEIYSAQTTNAVDVAGCLNETTVYGTTAQLKPIYRKGAWRLPAGSPAIDVVPAKDVSGMPEKDLNGNRRLVNTLYDLGAFELPNPCGLMLLVK